jgi:hypothetical protein
MKPGDLVLVHRFDKPTLCVYIGPAPLNARARWRFLAQGKIVDFDLENKLVYRYEVVSEAG